LARFWLDRFSRRLRLLTSPGQSDNSIPEFIMSVRSVSSHRDDSESGKTDFIGHAAPFAVVGVLAVVFLYIAVLYVLAW
jgi:hypothetical protein